MIKGLINSTREFIDNYYIAPIRDDSGYNIINTLTWAIILVISITILYDHFFKKKKIKIDREFTLSLLGWIIFGGSLRVIRDLKITTSSLLITPYIYILIFIISFSALLIALYIKKTKKTRLIYTWGLSGYLLSALTIIKIITAKETLDYTHFFLIYIIWSACFIGILIARKYLAKRFLTNWNTAAIMAHLLDAASTFTALTYAYGTTGYEKHVLGRALIEYLETNNILLISGSGSWVMFALKLAVIPVALWAIDRYSIDKTENRFLKMVIIILGLGIGIRNSFQVLTFGNAG